MALRFQVSRKILSSSDIVKGKLRRAGLKARKSLGQNFLVDTAVRDDIISTAALSHHDTVIEVGPGLGILTGELAKNAREVIAVEIDRGLAAELASKFKRNINVKIVNADILKLDITGLLKKDTAYKVIANIPYYITSPLLHYFIWTAPRPSLMVIMMQKEVAQAVTATPGKMSAISVSMQVYCKTELMRLVPASSFYPVPKVDSAIVKFSMLGEPAVKVENVDDFIDIVQHCFAAPRKQLKNSVALGLDIDPAEARTILEVSGIDHQRRAETLSLQEWQNLYQQIVKRR